jgi:hypothetical protein
MTLKQYKLASDLLGLSSNSNLELESLKGLPFWNNGFNFNIAIGLPIKDGQSLPLFDYELDIIKALSTHKHIWVLKATRLGITELILRYIAWLCLKDDELKGSQVCIVTGPRIDLAIDLIDRLKALFYDFTTFNTKETVLELNGVHIEAFPSHHLDSMRGLPNVSLIYLDEGDFLPKGQQTEVRKVSERYIAKSNPYIIFTSTPNAPGMLFETMEKEKDSIYKKFKLDYTVGLNKIFTTEEIQQQMKSPSFKQEYCCQYLGTIGNLFLPLQIQTCIDLGKQYSTIEPSLYTLKSIGIDAGYGSSATGIVVTEHVKPQDMKSKIRVLETYNIEKSTPTEITEICWSIYKKFNYMNCYFWVDGSSAATVNTLKQRWSESLSWPKQTTFGNSIKIRPVSFNSEHRNMLSNLHNVVTKGYLAIEEKHDKLITSLRTAYAEELNLKKDQTSYNDLLDALRLALKGYKIG